MNLHRWIRRRPVPHALMCGEQRILLSDGRRRWQDAVDAIFATTSEQIVAVDSKGSVLRVVQRSDVDDAPTQDETPADVTDTQKELAQVAQIISEAYSTAHDHARENSARGYELLAKFAELSFNRLASIERAYAALLQAHAKAIDADSGDGLESAIGGLVGKAMSGSMGSIIGKGDGKATT